MMGAAALLCVISSLEAVAGSYVMTDSTIRTAVAAWLSDSAAAEATWCTYAAPGPKKCARCEVYYTPCKFRGGVCCDSGYILGERPCWCCDGGVQSPYGALQPPI